MLLDWFNAYSWILTVKYVPAWVPGAAFKRKAMEWKKSTTAMVEVPFKAVKNAIVGWLPLPNPRLADLVSRLTAWLRPQ